MAYTISDFWIPRLHDCDRQSSVSSLAGWSVESTPNPSFIEADLNLRTGFGDVTAPIWFVAAPGAVGKSTLAKEISARTGSIYLDLAKADTVAGNYLTGGLVKNRLLTAWEENKTTILIDALDEARLRVTQSSFEDFLNDVETLARDRTLPTVFFGRVGIIEDAWLILSDFGQDCPVFDIDFFDTERAKMFILAALERLAQKPENRSLAASLQSHRTVYQNAAKSFVHGLEHTAAADGARFAGYAPVLEAVATVISGVTNPASINEAVQDAMQGQVLQHLADRILEREAIKLRAQLPDSISDTVKNELYGPEEQLTKLAGVIYGVSAPAVQVKLQTEHAAAYDAALQGFFPQHPFLDGTGHQASGAVFGAVINAHALFSISPEIIAAAERHAGQGPHTPNPFLIDFYLDVARGRLGNNPLVPPEHVVALYDSIQARASVGDIVRLTIEGEHELDEADVEIQISSTEKQGADRRILLRTSQAGVLRFGREVKGVAVDAPELDVIIGSGNPVELVAPVSLSVARLTFECPELVVRRGDHAENFEDAAVILEADELLDSKVVRVPLVRKGAEFSVSWPNASSYPWDQFADGSNGADARDINDSLNSLRRLILAFQSHGKGQLARFQDKIEHARMTKGDLGVAIRERMIMDGILSLKGKMYFLDPSALGTIVGATYQDLKLKRFNEKVRRYVSSIGN